MNFEERYVRWDTSSVKRSWDVNDVEPPEGVKGFEICNGTPLLSRWGAGGTATLRDGDPKTPTIADCVLNTNSLRFISERLKNALEAFGVTHVEYLPFTLTIDGAPIGLKYYAVNCLERPDCLDKDASGAEADYFDEDEVGDVKTIVMSKDPKRHLFQFDKFDRVFIVSMELAEALAKQAFSGIWWFALYDYGAFPEDKKGSPLSERIRSLSLKHAAGKPQPISSVAAPKKLTRASAKDVKAWLAAVPSDGVYRRMTFLAGEDDTWLEAYEDSPDDWPAFDPTRYRPFGLDGNGNHYLLDVDEGGQIVFLAHDAGYGRLEVLAPSMTEFAKDVKPKTS